MRCVHGDKADPRVVSGNAIPTFLTGKGAARNGPLPRKKECTMTLFTTILTAARKRALYRRTRDEIARMPLEVALDLGIYRGDAEAIAAKAVWG